MSDLLQMLLRRHEVYDAAQRRNDEKAGREAYVSGHPSSARIALDNLANEVIDDGAVEVAKCAEYREAERSRRTGEEAHFEHRLATELAGEHESADNTLLRRLQTLRENDGPGSERHRELTQNVLDAESELSRVRSHLASPRRPLDVNFLPWYVWVLVGLSAVESPLNRFSFEYFFEEAPWIAWLFALGCGAALMVFAHIAGAGVKQFGTQDRSAGARIVHGVAIVLSLAASLALIYAIAALRQGYLEFTSSAPAEDISASILDSTQPIEGMARVAFSVELSGVGIMFLLINGVLFLVALLLAWWRHDADALYEPAHNKLATAKDALKRQNSKYAAARRKLQSECDITLGRLAPEVADAELQLETLHRELADLDARAERVVAVIISRIAHRAQVRVSAFFRAAEKAGARLPAFEVPREREIAALISERQRRRKDGFTLHAVNTVRPEPHSEYARRETSAAANDERQNGASDERQDAPQKDEMQREQPRGTQ